MKHQVIGFCAHRSSAFCGLRDREECAWHSSELAEHERASVKRDIVRNPGARRAAAKRAAEWSTLDNLD